MAFFVPLLRLSFAMLMALDPGNDRYSDWWKT